MLILVFGILLSLTLIFLFLGHLMDAPYFKISGSVFLFIMGLVLMFGAVSYQSGSSEVTTYTYNAGNLSQTNSTVSYEYSLWGTDIINGLDINHVFGLLLCVIGVFTFMYSFFD